MKQFLLKCAFAGAVFMIIFSPALPVQAGDLKSAIIGETKQAAGGAFETNIPEGTQPEQYITGLIRRITGIYLGILGAVTVILILYSGFLWMTAGGNDQQVAKAKTIIKQTVIGMIIASLAYAIILFVISAVTRAGREQRRVGFVPHQQNFIASIAHYEK